MSAVVFISVYYEKKKTPQITALIRLFLLFQVWSTLKAKRIYFSFSIIFKVQVSAPTAVHFISQLIGPVKGRRSDRLKKGVDDRKMNECKKNLRNAEERNRILFLIKIDTGSVLRSPVSTTRGQAQKEAPRYSNVDDQIFFIHHITVRGTVQQTLNIPPIC